MRKAIAIDFDGCLCTDAFPAIGEPNWPVIKRAQAEQRAGAGLILWTCREDQLLLDAIAACEGWGLTFDSINESLPDWIEAFGTQPRKVGATEYWDDKAASIPVAGRFPDLPNAPLTLEELREMDGEPVFLDFGDGGEWVIVRIRQGTPYLTHKDAICNHVSFALECGAKIYHRKPEEG